MDGAKVQKTAAKVKADKPHNSTGRRPQRSDRGPQNSCETPKASSIPVKVSWACDMLAFKSSFKVGKAGRYRSVLIGMVPTNSDSKAMSMGSLMRFMSASSHEKGIQLGHADLAPSRPAVVALVGALSGFHLAQQGVHFV